MERWTGQKGSITAKAKKVALESTTLMKFQEDALTQKTIARDLVCAGSEVGLGAELGSVENGGSLLELRAGGEVAGRSLHLRYPQLTKMPVSIFGTTEATFAP
ncbi:hypothetical protein NDU88_002354 [Pleurodeles waltl]|uniref:Uncharacterized protein n=1 Tax=Pleurodeles waltl TaxID=8319 RepID=A0AAV7P9E8_PLEWA|nr:hypothetical protein NDU88_002354 [Pleurodeles waltl]